MAEYGIACETLDEAWDSYNHWLAQTPEMKGWPVKFGSTPYGGHYWYVVTYQETPL